MSVHRFSVTDSLWIFGGEHLRAVPAVRSEMAAFRERGAPVLALDRIDAEGLAALRRQLWSSDKHVVLMWLHPREVAALRPILRDRKNYSVMLDDWWISPHWFIRDAEYKIFRKYNGIAVRLGLAKFLEETPPVTAKPEPVVSYTVAGAVLRLPALAVSPLMELCQQWQRRGESISPEKLLYFPFPILEGSLPLAPEKKQYDFATTGSIYATWLMRDAFAPFRHSFANLYHDRRMLADGIARFADAPFKVYDWRRLNPPQFPKTWAEYTQVIRQSRFAISTGGLQEAAVPKYLDYACLGTPMIGRPLPFEFPWLDDCLFPIDIFRLKKNELKPLLHEAIARQPALQENCLHWRDRLLKLYSIPSLLDVLQAQADGQPVPPGYLRTDLKTQIAGKKLRP